MAPPKPTIPPAAEGHFSKVFDPWNSVGAGHQRPETKGPGGWRDSRNMKMNSQLVAGNTGGKRVHDTVGAGSLDFDEKHKVLIPKEVRARANCTVVDMLRGARPTSSSGRPVSPGEKDTRFNLAGDVDTVPDEEGEREPQEEVEKERKKKIFDSLVIYVNGSTHPLISDHKLKHVLAENGARVSFHLGRRQVTHVILGRPSSAGLGAGGGLAGGKLEREIRRVGGCGVKYVGVEWVLESIKAGKRLPEARFANLKVASRGQQSVYGAFSSVAAKAGAVAVGVAGAEPSASASASSSIGGG